MGYQIITEPRYIFKSSVNMFLKISELLLKMQTISPSPVFNLSTSHQNLNLPPNFTEIYTEDLCKFCFQTQTQSQEKLISPCGCSGSLKYVHRQCLQKWIAVQAHKNDGPLAQISFKLKKPDMKCKLCQKEIVFENEIKLIGHMFTVINWITIFYYIKKLKYYACISILGSLAINYYFLRYFGGKLWKVGQKIKDNTLIFLMVLSMSLILLEQTFIEVKWNQNSLQLSIPYLKSN